MANHKKRTPKSKLSFIDYVETGAKKVESIYQTGILSSLDRSISQRKTEDKYSFEIDLELCMYEDL